MTVCCDHWSSTKSVIELVDPLAPPFFPLSCFNATCILWSAVVFFPLPIISQMRRKLNIPNRMIRVKQGANENRETNDSQRSDDTRCRGGDTGGGRWSWGVEENKIHHTMHECGRRKESNHVRKLKSSLGTAGVL